MLLIGIFLGIAMDRFLFRPPPPPLPPLASGEQGSHLGERALLRMTRNLDLNAEQQEKMREIFARYLPELRGAGPGGGDFTAVRMKMREEIRKVLTPDQFAKFEEAYRRRAERWRRLQGQGPTPFPPPGPPPEPSAGPPPGK
jgi:Spy/CpxP family protein refolding chaperone